MSILTFGVVYTGDLSPRPSRGSSIDVIVMDLAAEQRGGTRKTRLTVAPAQPQKKIRVTQLTSAARLPPT
jgi:hypothetical protein